EAGTGYTLMDGYRLPPTRFSSEEILSLTAADKLMRKFVDADLYKNFDTAINKIKAHLRYTDKDQITTLENNMWMSSIGNTFNEQVPSALSTLFESIAERKIVNLSYQGNAYTECSYRETEPVGVFHQGNYWYFMAYCHLRDDYRQFRIDRIQQIKLTDRNFTKAHRELSFYLPQKEDISTTTVRISVPVSFAHYMHWDRPYYGFIEEEVIDGHAIMTFHSRNVEEEFARWFLMFADKAIILEPMSLKMRIKELVDAIRIP